MTFSKLLTRVRCRFEALRLSADLQRAYLAWIRLYIKYHAFKHPALMGEREILAFIRHLATERGASMDQLMEAQRALQSMYQHVFDLGADRLPGPPPGERPRPIESLFAPSPSSTRSALPAGQAAEQRAPRTAAYEPSWSTAA